MNHLQGTDIRQFRVGTSYGCCARDRLMARYAVGNVSGAALNPAVSVGVDLAHAVHGGTFVNCIASGARRQFGEGRVAPELFEWENMF